MRLALSTYLKGELGKLRNTGDAEEFLKHHLDKFLGDYGLSISPGALHQALEKQQKINDWVDTRDDSFLMRLVSSIDTLWRKNDVSKLIMNHSRWSIIQCKADELLVRQAEPGSDFKAIFERNRFEFINIFHDPELRLLPPYCHYTKGTQVDWPVFLSDIHQNRRRIFDGFHRAYQLMLNGWSDFNLCLPE